MLLFRINKLKLLCITKQGKSLLPLVLNGLRSSVLDHITNFDELQKIDFSNKKTAEM